MGYKITYVDEERRPVRGRTIALTLLFLALFLGWSIHGWEEGSGNILERLFPVPAEETREAASERSRQIGAGEGVVEAFTDFCNSVFPDGTEDLY